jgi:hypothetical protein
MIFTKIRMEMAFYDGDSGEVIRAIAYGEAGDTGDKGIAKAITSTVKYFLLRMFLLSTGDDVDSDSSSPEASRSNVKPMAKPQALQGKPSNGAASNEFALFLAKIGAAKTYGELEAIGKGAKPQMSAEQEKTGRAAYVLKRESLEQQDDGRSEQDELSFGGQP